MRCYRLFCIIVLFCPLVRGGSPFDYFLFDPSESVFLKTDLSFLLEPPKHSLITNPVDYEFWVGVAIKIDAMVEYPNINSYLQSNHLPKNLHAQLKQILEGIFAANQLFIFTLLNKITDNAQRNRLLLSLFSYPELLLRVSELDEDTFQEFLEACLNDSRLLQLAIVVLDSDQYGAAYEDESSQFAPLIRSDKLFFADQIKVILGLRRNTGVYFSFLIPWLLSQQDFHNGLETIARVFSEVIASEEASADSAVIFASQLFQNRFSLHLDQLLDYNELTGFHAILDTFFNNMNQGYSNNSSEMAWCLIRLLTRCSSDNNRYRFNIRHFIKVLSKELEASNASVPNNRAISFGTNLQITP